MANSPYGCRVVDSTSMVTANAHLVIFAHGKNRYTLSIKAIRPTENSHVLWIQIPVSFSLRTCFTVN